MFDPFVVPGVFLHMGWKKRSVGPFSVARGRNGLAGARASRPYRYWQLKMRSDGVWAEIVGCESRQERGRRADGNRKATRRMADRVRAIMKD